MGKHALVIMSFWVSAGICIGSKWSDLYFSGGEFVFTLLVVNFIAMTGAFYLMAYVASCFIDAWKLFNIWIGK